MFKYIYIILSLIDFIYSNPIQTNGAAQCNLTGFFIPSNGYGYAVVNSNTTMCTCPDNRHSTVNKPCRICQRENICGSKDAFCSEESSYFLTTNRTSYYACFCRSGSVEYNKKCPEDLIDETTNTLITNTSVTETISNFLSTTVSIDETTETLSMLTTNLIQETSVNPSTHSSTTTFSNSSKNSYSLLTTYVIILLNIFYFLNK